MSQDWSRRLHDAYKDAGREPLRRVRLPAESTMAVSGEGDHAVISLRPGAVASNMQENAAAFEGWSLALNYWCGAKVTLEWPPICPDPDPKIAIGRERHHQRFLYRLDRFRSLFDWFSVSSTSPVSRSRVSDGQPLYLNVPGDEGQHSDGSGQATGKPRPEYDLESRLLRDPNFHRHYGFSEGAMKDRQFPVGLFSTSTPAIASAVFPGGKGAIDLVCLDEKTFWLFELKAERNIPIGTITELLFYASVMRDAAMGRFNFASGVGSRATFPPERLREVEAITGVMLGHDLHPLLSDPGLLNLLNDAVRTRWNSATGAPAVTFQAGKILPGERLKIEDVI